MTVEKNTGKRRKGIYLLPNLFTTAGLFSGFYAIVSAMSGNFENAAVAIFVAMIMDGLDGRVARLTNTESEFGVQYDSLSDMVCFGLAPSLVIYEWALRDMLGDGWIWAKMGWLAAFIYTAGAALRLARFNTQVTVVDKRFFQGLPSPAAAAVLASLVWMCVDLDIPGQDLQLPVLILTTLVGILMVSNFRYYSFKDVDFKNRVSFMKILMVIPLFVFISIDPPKVLFIVFLIYVLSGPVYTLSLLRQKRKERLEE